MNLPLVALGLMLAIQSQDPVADLVKELGSNEYAARESAQKKLEGMGQGVLPQLKAALEKAEDPEVRTRLEDIIKKLDRPVKAEHVEEARPDPTLELERMAKIVEELQKVLADKGASAEDKVKKVAGLAEELRSAPRPRDRNAPSGNGKIIQFRVCRDFRKDPKGEPEDLNKMIERVLRERGMAEDPKPEKKEEPKKD